MRYPASEKVEIIHIVEQSHLSARQTLAQIGIPRATFYRWYDQYQTGGSEALEDRTSRPRRIWNPIPDKIRDQILEMALERRELSPRELSPRELAVTFTDEQRYFLSEASVYRLLKAHDLITSPDYQSGLPVRITSLSCDEGGQRVQRPEDAPCSRCSLPPAATGQGSHRARQPQGKAATGQGSHRARQPQGKAATGQGSHRARQPQGKIERWHQTLKNRILLENYYLPGDFEKQVETFVEHYNHQRYHESLKNVTPADAYCGRAQAILKQRERIKRKTIEQRRLRHQRQAA